jgi:hypothetical protein
MLTLSVVAAAAAVGAADRTETAKSAKKRLGGQITNVGSGKCITPEPAQEFAFVRQLDCNTPGAKNRWVRDESPENPYFTLKLSGTDPALCLGVDEGSNRPNTVLRLFKCDGKVNQRWRIHSRSRIKNYSQHCIGVDGGSSEDHAQLKQFVCDNRVNQKWKMH